MKTPVNEAVWQMLRAATGTRTVAELAGACGCSRRSVEQRILYWRNANLIEQTPGKPASYAMKEATKAQAKPPRFSRQGTPLPPLEPATAPLWRAIRATSKRGTFDVPMLSMIAGTSTTYALNYVNRLRRAGYIRLASERWHGSPAAFRLVRDTGPVAPRVDVRRGTRVLIDANNGQRIDISPGRLSLRERTSVASVDGGVS